ncbi:MAG: hypothetical protein LQ346_007164 [Caloplaca aetnensis]|nr:MAG: hypothetical protein LQ346_007164 [Caloplaca aetnensis]
MDTKSDLPTPRLPFPPVTRSHILHCSYHSWYPKYRSLTPKARLIPLTAPFLAYLRADGILLPPEETDYDPYSSTETDSGIFSSTSTPTGSSNSDSDSDSYIDPSLSWPEIHSAIASTIAELGGNVVPKLNWSAPKDAIWINATNNMECRSPNDIYLLLKSSDFITHDLEQAFDGCSPPPSSKNDSESNTTVPYHLILRKTIPALATSLEFRCFVRARTLVGICQRDLNYYDFLPDLTATLRPQIQAFFEENLQGTFEDDNWVFDVYIPPPHRRVWLIDINPWAPRTDPLLFSWMEILGMSVPEKHEASADDINGAANRNAADAGSVTEDSDEEETEEEEVIFTPEFRLVGRNDPEAYSFNTPQYSAHKMPKDVVDASGDGEAGLREFMGRWREIVREQEQGERDEER